MLFEGYLQVCLEANDQRLLADIPLNPVPWCQPRVVWKKYLEPLAQREGRPIQNAQNQWLAPAREPLRCLGQRAWVVHAHDETTVEEFLTNLVIISERDGFPISEDDKNAAWVWIRRVIRNSVRGTQDQHEIDTLVNKVYQAVVSRFDLPATDWSLRAYIKETARGYKRDERKKLTAEASPKPCLDPVSGEWIYPDAWMVQEFDVNLRTVARWKRDHGITTREFSEVQHATFSKVYGPKRELKRLREQARNAGMSPRAAAENVKKLSQRKKKPDGTPDWDTIKAHIEHYGREAEVTAPSEDAMSLENQIAEWEVRFAEAELGSDEWCDARDALQRLRQRQQGAHP